LCVKGFHEIPGLVGGKNITLKFVNEAWNTFFTYDLLPLVEPGEKR